MAKLTAAADHVAEKSGARRRNRGARAKTADQSGGHCRAYHRGACCRLGGRPSRGHRRAVPASCFRPTHDRAPLGFGPNVRVGVFHVQLRPLRATCAAESPEPAPNAFLRHFADRYTPLILICSDIRDGLCQK
jgi:hypothetical protein